MLVRAHCWVRRWVRPGSLSPSDAAQHRVVGFVQAGSAGGPDLSRSRHRGHIQDAAPRFVGQPLREDVLQVGTGLGQERQLGRGAAHFIHDFTGPDVHAIPFEAHDISLCVLWVTMWEVFQPEDILAASNYILNCHFDHRKCHRNGRGCSRVLWATSACHRKCHGYGSGIIAAELTRPDRIDSLIICRIWENTNRG